MKETSKSNRRRANNWKFQNLYFVGYGIDVGCGDDLFDKSLFSNVKSILGFDKTDGNAEQLSSYVDYHYDFVHASNVLEHLANPPEAVKSWLRACKTGGYVIFTVPDEDLYEQGVWPSTFNREHKHTFTINKKQSWSPVSINMLDLLSQIDNIEIMEISLENTGYDYNPKTRYDQTYSPGGAEAFIEVVIRKVGEV